MTHDPKFDPQPGDRLINCSRQVIRRAGDLIVFGIDSGDSYCGAYTCTLKDWQEWANGSCLPEEDWR